nr:hypothetical protein HK105_002984 [Polyrhizophydium stewartii]
MPRRCEPHPPAHAIAAHLLPPTPPTPVYATATTAHSGQAPACDQLPNELLIKVLQRLYLVPAVDTLVDACAVVSRRWRQCTLHVLRNPPPIPSLAGRSPADELAARRLRREVAVDLGFMPASPVLVPSAFQVVADTAADTTHAHGWRVRLIAHPTLHGGPLLTMQTRFGSEALRATLIDGSSGLESLRDAIIRLGRMRLIDQNARRDGEGSEDGHDSDDQNEALEDPNAQDQNMHDLDAHGGQALETAQDAHHARVRDASVAPMSSRRTLETIEQILDARRPLGPEAAGGDSDGFYIVVCGGAVPDGVSGRDAFDDILESRGPHARLSPMHRRYGLLALGRCDAVGDSGSDLGALCIDARMRCDGGLDVAVDAGSVSGLDGNTALVRI